MIKMGKQELEEARYRKCNDDGKTKREPAKVVRWRHWKGHEKSVFAFTVHIMEERFWNVVEHTGKMIKTVLEQVKVNVTFLFLEMCLTFVMPKMTDFSETHKKIII